MIRHTRNTQQIYDFIITFRRTHSYGPSVSQVAEAIGKKYSTTLQIIYAYNGILWLRTPGAVNSLDVLPQQPESQANND